MSQGLEPIQATLRRRLNQRGLGQAAEAAQVCAAANAVAAGRFVALRYRDGVIWLGVAHAVALAELTMEVPGLAAAIKSQLSWPAERQLVVRLVRSKPS